jgi:hypothetical protein
MFALSNLRSALFMSALVLFTLFCLPFARFCLLLAGSLPQRQCKLHTEVGFSAPA